MTKGLRISSISPAGFRRCGIRHTPEPVDHPLTRFTPDQVEALKKETQLKVVEIDMPAESDSRQDGAAAARAATITAAVIAASKVAEGKKPTQKAVEAITGFDITAAELDAAWKAARQSA